MKTLVVEDDFTSRLYLSNLLQGFGETHAVVNGQEAVAAFSSAMDTGRPYDLVCLDIMMPELDGQGTLRAIRSLEQEAGVLVGRGAKVIMVSALGDKDNVLTAFRELCDAYLVKPISKAQLQGQLQTLGLTR
ncbi:MAG: response regulator [Syntrophobacteraceae bacterium]